MDKKTKFLYFIFVLAITGSIAMTYWRIVVKQDYMVTLEVNCNPNFERCFVRASDLNDGNIENDQNDVNNNNDNIEGLVLEDNTPYISRKYYKIITKKASALLFCMKDNEKCDCSFDDIECSEVVCFDDSSIQDGDYCSDPDSYRHIINQ